MFRWSWIVLQATGLLAFLAVSTLVLKVLSPTVHIGDDNDR